MLKVIEPRPTAREFTVNWIAYAARSGLVLAPANSTPLSPDARHVGGGAVELLEEPPFPIVLSEEEVKSILRPEAVAATHFGPAGQDKLYNQDFGISAVFETPSGPVSLAVVSDGISNGVLWPGRTSRIVGLIAVQVARAFVAERGGIAVGDAEDFVARLTGDINAAFERDRIQLMEGKTRDPEWAPNVYDMFVERRADWYGATMLVAMVGAVEGFCVMAGDGAVIEAWDTDGGTPDIFIHQVSEESSLLSCYVSIDFGVEQFATTALKRGPRGRHVVLATDGLDRTIHRRSGLERLFAFPLEDPGQLFMALDEMSQQEGVEQDNISIARASAPVADAASRVKALAVAILNGVRVRHASPDEAQSPAEDKPKRTWLDRLKLKGKAETSGENP